MAYDTEGYGKVANPFWDLPEEGGSGGGGDLPTPARPGQMLISKLNATQSGLETTWKDIYDMISEETNLFSSDAVDVGKVFTKYGSGTRDIGWVKAQAAYTDYSNSSSGLSATTVQGAIDEIAQSSGERRRNVKIFHQTATWSSADAAFTRAIPAVWQSNILEEDHAGVDISTYSDFLLEIDFCTQRNYDLGKMVAFSFYLNREDILSAMPIEPESSSDTGFQLILTARAKTGSNIEDLTVYLNFDAYGTSKESDPEVYSLVPKAINIQPSSSTSDFTKNGEGIHCVLWAVDRTNYINS